MVRFSPEIDLVAITFLAMPSRTKNGTCSHQLRPYFASCTLRKHKLATSLLSALLTQQGREGSRIPIDLVG